MVVVDRDRCAALLRCVRFAATHARPGTNPSQTDDGVPPYDFTVPAAHRQCSRTSGKRQFLQLLTSTGCFPWSGVHRGCSFSVLFLRWAVPVGLCFVSLVNCVVCQMQKYSFAALLLYFSSIGAVAFGQSLHSGPVLWLQVTEFVIPFGVSSDWAKREFSTFRFQYCDSEEKKHADKNNTQLEVSTLFKCASRKKKCYWIFKTYKVRLFSQKFQTDSIENRHHLIDEYGSNLMSIPCWILYGP